MCGLAGIIDSRLSDEQTRGCVWRMCRAMAHRGPDEETVRRLGPVMAGFRRLAVIDIEGGGQPIANEDGTVHVLMNGEIYNHRELRGELEGRGHRFRTRSDAEVIVHLWEEKGVGLLRDLEGMFGLAVIDAGRGQTLLGRDALGVKPLYRARVGGSVMFASEMEALVRSGYGRFSLDKEAVGEYFAWEYVPSPRTLLREVRRIEPGGYELYDAHGELMAGGQFWSLLDEVEAAGDAGLGWDERAWVERVEGALERSVRGQLVSDRPVGVFVSGGLDSSLVASAAPREICAHSLSVGGAGYDELPWARALARQMGLSHRYSCASADMSGLVNEVVGRLDDPIGDTSVFPTYLICGAASNEITVALSGDGGDELFGGYDTYAAERCARLLGGVLGPASGFVRRLGRPGAGKKTLRNRLMHFAEGAAYSPALRHARWRRYGGGEVGRRVWTAEAREAMGDGVSRHVLRYFEEASGLSPLNQMLYVDLKSFLVDNCLTKMDRMAMAHSLEVRVPFLDRELVRLAFSMPDGLKMRLWERKRVLRMLARRRCSACGVGRRKEGFSAPMKDWLRGPLAGVLKEASETVNRWRGELFDEDGLAWVRGEHASGARNHSHFLWPLVVFSMWRRRMGV